MAVYALAAPVGSSALLAGSPDEQAVMREVSLSSPVYCWDCQAGGSQNICLERFGHPVGVRKEAS